MKSKPKKFIEQPTYPGGKKALDDFIKTNLVYPQEALTNKIQGTVTLKFDIDAYGKVIEATVTHGIGFGCDEEAIRLIKLLRYPKKIYRGLHVIYHQIISIHFRLPDAPPVPLQQDIVIQYQYTETKSSPSSDETFSYTITPE